MREFQILRFEWKTFKNYLGQKNTRLAGFILLMVLWGLYLVGLSFSIPFLKSVAADFIPALALSISNGIPFVFIFSLFIGTSLVSSIREGMDQQLKMLFQAPLNPKIALFIKLGINALGLSTIFILVLTPLIIWLMILLEASVFLIFLQVFLLFLGIIVFTFLGEFLGVFLLRYGRRGKIIFGLAGAVLGAAFYYLYFSVLGGNYEAIQNLAFLTHPYSPFRWFVSPIHFALTPQPLAYLLLQTVVLIGSTTLMLYIITSLTTASLLNGRFQPKPPQRKRTPVTWETQRSLFPFDFKTSGIFRKDLSLIKREPNLLTSAMAIVFIGIIYYFVMGSHFPPLFLLFFTFFLVALVPLGLISTLFGVEGRSLSHLVSSPVAPQKIVKGKAYASLLVQLAFSIALGFISHFYHQYTVWETLWIAVTLLTLSITTTAIASPLVVKFVDFDAENPRKALHALGSLLVLCAIGAGIAPHILFTYFAFTGSFMSVLLGVLYYAVVPFILWKYCLNKAGNILSNREIPR